LQGYFKTGEGEYGAGDVFVGVRMPVIRKTVKPYRDLPLSEIEIVLASPVHEHRMAALVICAERAKRFKRRGETAEHKALYDFYLAHTDRINNWDLVDISCRDVVGEYLLTTGDVKPLKRLAKSKNIWERRIAIVSTWSFIRAGQLDPTFEISEILLGDTHDLMHKATGWMLRSAGDKDRAALERFLKMHAHEMPRTALRYTIEKMTPERRKYWLAFDAPDR
jgi:3-methyladenine DNA glycosylase AlkD